MLLGRAAVPESRLPAGRAAARGRLAAALAAEGTAPAGPAATGLGTGMSPVLFAGRPDTGADGAPPRVRLGAPVTPANAGASLAAFGAGLPPLRGRLGAPPSLAAFGADEVPKGRAAGGLPAASSRALFPGRPDAGAEAPPLRARFSSGRSGPNGRAGRDPDDLGAAASRVRFSGRPDAGADALPLRVPLSADRLGPGLPEGLMRFCDGRAAPEEADGLADEREGPDFPERLLMGIRSSSQSRTPRVVPHSVPVRPPTDKRTGQ